MLQTFISGIDLTSQRKRASNFLQSSTWVQNKGTLIKKKKKKKIKIKQGFKRRKKTKAKQNTNIAAKRPKKYCFSQLNSVNLWRSTCTSPSPFLKFSTKALASWLGSQVFILFILMFFLLYGPTSRQITYTSAPTLVVNCIVKLFPVLHFTNLY